MTLFSIRSLRLNGLLQTSCRSKFGESCSKVDLRPSRLSKSLRLTTLLSRRPERIRKCFSAYLRVSWHFLSPFAAARRELGGRHAGFAVRDARKAVRAAKFSHLGPQNLHVGPPFSPVVRPLLHVGSRNLNVGPPFSPGVRPFLHLLLAKPECWTTIFTGRPDRLLFYYFTISCPLGSRQEVFLHLGQHFLHVGSRFCMSAKRIPPQGCAAARGLQKSSPGSS